MSLSKRVRPGVEAAPWVVQEIAALEAKVRELDEERDRAVRDTKETCARLLELRSDDVRLMAGEVTAQELRTIMAVLSCLRTKMRSSAYVTVKEGKERDV